MQKDFIKFNSDLTVLPSTSIKSALKVIEKGEERICFIVNKKGDLIASISDGDIRRALLNGHNLGTKISKIQKRKPIFAYQGSSYEEIIKKFSNRIRVIPVLKRNGKYIGHLSRSKFFLL